MWVSLGWKDYELLDCGGGERLENWGGYLLRRPDPQAVWQPGGSPLWEQARGVYTRSSSGGGSWEKKDLPDCWQVRYRELTFNIKAMNFKHTGVFPEQAANWDFIDAKIKAAGRPVSVLNLFAYTGGATLAAAAAGASVCHVDAARGMVQQAKENAKSSGLENAPIRYIVDDCLKFIRREKTRGKRYDGIVMDPPSYGRGPSGELWKFEDNIEQLIAACADILSDGAIFFVVSSYTAGVSPSVPAYILGQTVKRRFGGRVDAQELGLPVKQTGLYLPCGSAGRWERE